MLGIAVIQIQTLGRAYILQHVDVTAVIVVILAERVARKQNHLARITLQPRKSRRTAIHGIRIICLGLHQGIILIREINRPQGRVRFHRLDLNQGLNSALLGRLILHISQHAHQYNSQNDHKSSQNKIHVFFH